MQNQSFSNRFFIAERLFLQWSIGMKYNNCSHIHIGKLIAERLAMRGMTYADFARKLYIDRTTVYSIIRSKSIDIERLIKISNILQYDFISEVYYKKHQPPHYCITISKELAHQLAQEGSVNVELVVYDPEMHSKDLNL